MHWLLFNSFIFILLFLDLFVFHKKEVKIGLKEGLLWSFFWITLALLFNLFIYFWKGPIQAIEFFTGYLIEKSLSLDNLFVITLIFSYFKIPAKKQHTILFWGIMGALIMRILFILGGISLISKFHWTLYILGAFLLFTGLKLLFQKTENRGDPNKSYLVKAIKKLFPKISSFALALITIEYTDLIFALDSIPAILAITKDAFIVYTSNAFAILGLRSLYFVLAHFLERFHYLKTGISLILVFIGLKMVISPFYPIPIHYSLAIVILILSTSILLSFKKQKNKPR